MPCPPLPIRNHRSGDFSVIAALAFVFTALLLGVGCTRALDAAYTAITKKPELLERAVRDRSLVATYIRPNDPHARRGVIVLGGSEGGIGSAEFLGRTLAARGFAVLALAYFGAERLPPTLADIPLEYFDAAVAWLQQQPGVTPGGIAILGTSRGAEAALLVAAYNPSIDRVVAYAPTHVVWGPVELHPRPSTSAWRRDGQPLPFLTPVRSSAPISGPYRGTPDFLAALDDPRAAVAAIIPIERSAAAILLLSGEDDQIWPATHMAQQLVTRLETHRHPYRVEHLSFPGAGHAWLPGFDLRITEFKHPLGITLAIGGTPEANRRAQEQSWQKVLEFLAATETRRVERRSH